MRHVEVVAEYAVWEGVVAWGMCIYTRAHVCMWVCGGGAKFWSMLISVLEIWR